MSLLAGLVMVQGAGAGEKILKIGISATYSGGFAAVGQHISDGQIDYLHWLSKNGGIAYTDPATGKPETVNLQLIVEDNQYNAAKAVLAYQQFREQGVNVILGFGSTPGEACSAKASQDHLPYLAWYSYASPAGYKPRPRYYWSFLPTVAESATPMIKWFITRKWQDERPARIGIMVADLPSWQMIKKPGLMAGYISSLGGELAGIEAFPLATPDLTPIAARLIFEKKVDCLVLIGALPHTVLLAKNLKQMGADLEKTTVVCNLSAWDESLFKSAPHLIEGMYGEVHMVSVDQKVPGMEKVREVAAWAGRDTKALVMNYTNGFLGAIVLETAIRRALEKHGYEKTAASGEPIRDELDSFRVTDAMQLCPALEVRYPDEPYFLNHARIVRAKAGKFEDSSDWLMIDRITGALE